MEETVNSRLRRAIKDAGVSQTALANALGMSQQQVSYNLGRSEDDLSIGFVRQACEVVGVSPASIIFGASDSTGQFVSPVVRPIVEELNHATAYPKTIQAHLFGGILAQLKKSRELVDSGEWR